MSIDNFLNALNEKFINSELDVNKELEELQKELEACTSANAALKDENDQLQAKLNALSAKKSSKKGE